MRLGGHSVLQGVCPGQRAALRLALVVPERALSLPHRHYRRCRRMDGRREPDPHRVPPLLGHPQRGHPAQAVDGTGEPGSDRRLHLDQRRHLPDEPRRAGAHPYSQGTGTAPTRILQRALPRRDAPHDGTARRIGLACAELRHPYAVVVREGTAGGVPACR